MSFLSAVFFDHPSREISVIGVTGTDGKSSTVSFIHQLFELTGHSSGFFSTVQWKLDTNIHHNAFRQSTPEAPQVHQFLRAMVENGKQFAVLEATSHGLCLETSRLADVVFSCGVLTNVTLEHLEFHQTVENYRRDKARLFQALQNGPQDAFGVVNLDDPYHTIFINAAGNRQVLTYSMHNPLADLSVSSVQETPQGLLIKLVWQKREAEGLLNLVGLFNVENILAALLVVSASLMKQDARYDPLWLLRLVDKIQSVKGRMCVVDQGQDFRVLVDYAHTPGAFEKLLPAVRATTKGRLITVFGSGGERDREKRPLQGALADRWSDIVILTDEDPRLEGSWPIIAEIASGIQNKVDEVSLFQIVPRYDAVLKALSLAQKDDTVLLLGKGHEQSIITGVKIEPYDEEATARKLLSQIGWRG